MRLDRSTDVGTSWGGETITPTKKVLLHFSLMLTAFRSARWWMGGGYMFPISISFLPSPSRHHICFEVGSVSKKLIGCGACLLFFFPTTVRLEHRHNPLHSDECWI